MRAREREARRAAAGARSAWASLLRASFYCALGLVGVVNLIYAWPRNVPSAARAGLTARRLAGEGTDGGAREQRTKPPVSAVNLHCGDAAVDCIHRRHVGNCSTHLLKGFHTCLDACGVCPALEHAIRSSMHLSEAQLAVWSRSGPPPCRDEGGASCWVLSAEACARAPLELALRCKATCGACTPTDNGTGEDVEGAAGGGSSSSSSRVAAASATAVQLQQQQQQQGQGASECHDLLDTCLLWSRREPRVCEAAPGAMQALWWVAVACRHTCGLCGRAGGGAAGAAAAAATGARTAEQRRTLEVVSGSDADAGGSAGAGDAAAALAAAAGLGVQVGLGADGAPRVAVYEALAADPSACKDSDPLCPSWRDAGECGRNMGFMARSCPASCGTCPVQLHLPQPLAKVRLNNGVLMPTVGYGSAALGDATGQAVRWALEAGYRHVDSAQAREWYREDLVGQALADFLGSGGGGGAGGPAGGGALPLLTVDGAAAAAAAAAPPGGGGGGRGGGGGKDEAVGRVARADVFLTSKLHPRHLGYAATLAHFNASLRDLRTPYVDLFLLHYAECWGDLCGGVQPEGNFRDSWRALEQLYDAGLARAIGISNFAPSQVEALLAAARVRPAVLQTHVDPLERSPQMLELCRREGITVTAYSTLGTQYGGSRNPVLSSPVLAAIGRDSGGRGAAAVALRWALQQGLVVLPRSSNPGRIADNLRLYDWGLGAGHMRQIASLRDAG